MVWIGLDDRPESPCGDERICPGLFASSTSWLEDLFLGFGAAVLVVLLWEIARRTLPVANELEEKLGSLLGGLERDEALALALLSGFAEELFFRGALQGSVGWLLATVLFALLHTGPGRALKLWSVFAFLAGLVFAGLQLWRGNLLAPMTAHALINAAGLWRMTGTGLGENEE